MISLSKIYVLYYHYHIFYNKEISSSFSITESVSSPETMKNGVMTEALPVIDLKKKSKLGNLLESLRVRSEKFPSFSRKKHAYKIHRKYIDSQPVKEK